MCSTSWLKIHTCQIVIPFLVFISATWILFVSLIPIIYNEINFLIDLQFHLFIITI